MKEFTLNRRFERLMTPVGLAGRRGTTRRQPRDGVQMDAAQMPFRSILSPGASAAPELREPPDFFHDLNLDQIVASITAGWKAYDLAPFFQAPLHDLDAIAWRQEVMQELGQKNVLDAITSFSQKMRAMREHLEQIEKLYYKFEKERWLLRAVEIYCGGLETLRDDLARLDLTSRGLRAFREYLTGYIGADSFARLAGDARKLTLDLAAIRYALVVKGSALTVRTCEGEADYSAEVERTIHHTSIAID